ncbi:MAG: tetratricopeptide repeat protein, partial [bacterium]
MVKRKLLLLILGVMFSVAGLCAENIEKAWKLYNEKDYPKAYLEFEKLYNKNPKDIEALNGMGYAEYMTKNYKSARDKFETSLRLNPEQYDVVTMIGWCYLREGNPDKAIEIFKRQVGLNPNIVDVHYGLGLSFNQKGYKRSALSEFYTVISLLPSYLINDEFLKILGKTPDYSPLYNDLGWRLYHLGLTKESLEIFEMGLKNNDTAELIRGAGYAAFKLNKLDLSIEYCKNSLVKNPNLLPVWETAYAAEAGLSYSFYSDARTTLAWAYFYKKNYTNAMQEFQSSLKRNPDWPDANNGMGWVLYSLKRYQEAEDYFNRAIKIDPKYLDAYSGLSAIYNAKIGKTGEGWKYYYLGEYEKALVFFSKQLQKNDITEEIKCQSERGLAWSNLRLNRYDEAKEYFDYLLKLNILDYDAILGMGYTLYGKKNFNGAIQRLKEAIKIFPLDLEAELTLGWSYFKTGNYADSLIEFRRAVHINPYFADPYRGVGFSLVKIGRLDEGKESLITAINIAPWFVDNNELTTLINENKTLDELYITLAWAYYNHGLYSKALDTVEIIKEKQIRYPDLDLLGGYIYYQDKKYSDTVWCLTNFLKTIPKREKEFGKFSEALNTLGWAYYHL